MTIRSTGPILALHGDVAECRTFTANRLQKRSQLRAKDQNYLTKVEGSRIEHYRKPIIFWFHNFK